jgi:hypothetical protein
LLAALAIGLGLAGCGRSTPPPAPTNAASTPGPLTAPVDYLGAASKAQQRARQVTQTASLTQAIQQFHAGEDRYPKNLNELVSEGYLARLPQPPNGMKFDYNPATGQVRTVPR